MAIGEQRRPDLIEQAQTKIKKAIKVIAKLKDRKTVRGDKLHQKKRRLCMMQSRLSHLQADQASGKTRLCFGSMKLFHAQYALEANGYASHQEWQQEWRIERSSQFFCPGQQG